ncbi:MAG: hypothetical protein P8Q14_10345 [Vicingaceae bacterium]|nr:hypothetical protein [Vicingaceae bacterium]
MKKYTLIVFSVLTSLSLTAFSCTNINVSETDNKTERTTNDSPKFIYDIDSRFIANISKEEISKAKTIIDLIPEDAGWDNFEFKQVTIRLMPDENTNYSKGKSKILNLEQIELLKTVDYSANFIVDTYIKSKYPSAHDHYPYYITVIPEKEANYIGGKEALINYLKEGCASTIAKIEKGNLTAGKIRFTISTSGNIKNIYLESTSGYPTVDQKMLDLMNLNNGLWLPATNEKGEKVEQELVFSFGTMGC